MERVEKRVEIDVGNRLYDDGGAESEIRTCRSLTNQDDTQTHTIHEHGVMKDRAESDQIKCRSVGQTSISNLFYIWFLLIIWWRLCGYFYNFLVSVATNFVVVVVEGEQCKHTKYKERKEREIK